MRLAAAVIVLGACANNPGMPRYWHTTPAPLPSAGPARPPATVAMKMKMLPWWSLTDDEHFVLRFESSPADAEPVHGRRMGALRSRDIDITNEVFEAVRCAWSDSDKCSTPIQRAGELAHDAISEARAELRAHAAEAGAGVVADVRCFADRRPPRDESHGPSHLWCEGIAFDTGAPPIATTPIATDATTSAAAAPTGATTSAATTFWAQPTDATSTGATMPVASTSPLAATTPPVGAPTAASNGAAASVQAFVAPAGEYDPATPRDHEVSLPQARFTLVADAGVGMMGGKPVVSSTLGIRYRPIELGFYIVDLQRESVGPRDGGTVGLGLTAMGRKAIKPHSQADAIFGGSAIAAFQNGATNPDFDGLYQGFVGMAYQSRWNIFHGQPWVQLRAGGATGTALKNKPVPLVELHFGLATPERR